MGIERCKRGREHNTISEEGEDNKEDEQQQQDHTAATESAFSFRILELPMHLINDILARLPPKTIFCCRCVCKTFFKILTDPYFSKIHLVKAPSVAASLILQDGSNPSAFHFVYMLDLEETSSAASSNKKPYYSSSSSSSAPPRLHYSHPCHALNVQNTKFHFSDGEVTLVGSCNGLFCLNHTSWPRPLHYICNPVLGELTVLPQPTYLAPTYTYLNHSGFGFSPKTQQYKVLSFMRMSYTDPMTELVSSKTVAEICTFGSESWRRIGDAPLPRSQGSFDSFLNGILHWITDSFTAFNLICSFDFEMEQFQSVPAPTHFNPDCVHKISWINVGVLAGCLCLCYVLDDAQFDVWVMKDYGVKESWTRAFVIDIDFYCGLQVNHLHQPIKFLDNGDLLFIYDSSSIVSYSHRKGTFREFKAFDTHNVQVIAHIPSFISLQKIARGDLVRNIKWKRWDGMNIYVISDRMHDY